jgi:uncharacterized membrane protein
MSTYALAFLIGVIAGLRSMTAPATVSWGARRLAACGEYLAGFWVSDNAVHSECEAIGELINDKLPKTLAGKRPCRSRRGL